MARDGCKAIPCRPGPLLDRVQGTADALRLLAVQLAILEGFTCLAADSPQPSPQFCDPRQ